jgi:hypothetical protein
MTNNIVGTGVLEALSATMTTDASVITYPQRLLELACENIKRGELDFAVILSHTACEIATERSISGAFAAKNVQYLEKWATGRLISYNLANDVVRELYSTLTGDETIQNEPFWENFKTSAKRRNLVVHKGKDIEQAEAEESLEAAIALVGYLKR